MLVELNEIGDETVSFRIQNEEKRKNLHERIKHVLACGIVLPYILLLIEQAFWNFTIPEAYENLALIVIGYYFAKL